MTPAQMARTECCSHGSGGMCQGAIFGFEPFQDDENEDEMQKVLHQERRFESVAKTTRISPLVHYATLDEGKPCAIADGRRCEFFERCILPLADQEPPPDDLRLQRQRQDARTAYRREHNLLTAKGTVGRVCPDCGKERAKSKQRCPECAKDRRREMERKRLRRLRAS